MPSVVGAERSANRCVGKIVAAVLAALMLVGAAVARLRPRPVTGAADAPDTGPDGMVARRPGTRRRMSPLVTCTRIALEEAVHNQVHIPADDCLITTLSVSGLTRPIPDHRSLHNLD